MPDFRFVPGTFGVEPATQKPVLVLRVVFSELKGCGCASI